MSKKVAIDIQSPLVLGEKPPVPKVCGVKPANNQVLVELLTQQEVLGTNLTIAGESKELQLAPQAYVVALGPTVNKECGIQPGDRVVLTGSGTYVPKYDDHHRLRMVVLPDMIKAILVEEQS